LHGKTQLQIVSGNPDTVIKKLQHIMDIVDPGYMVLWGREGPMSHQVAMRSIDLLGQEVIPALKAYQATGTRGGHAASAKDMPHSEALVYGAAPP